MFNEAPRSLRVEAIDKIPDLLEKLIKEAEAIAKKVRAKVSQATELAEAIQQTAVDVATKKPTPPSSQKVRP